jgi:DNA-directed RNA polymerase specialized sigma24 family protein
MDNDLLIKLHARISMGDPVAPDQLVSECLVPLQASLRRRWFTLPRETVQEAVIDAILSYLQCPHAFDPQRNPSLAAYLKMIASRRLSDAVRKWTRLKRREISVGGIVELDRYETKRTVEAEATALAGEGASEGLAPELEELLIEILPDPRDRRLLQLICQGRQEISVYADILGIGSLSESEQRRTVKQHRDRILKRLIRRREEFRRFFND